MDAAVVAAIEDMEVTMRKLINLGRVSAVTQAIFPFVTRELGTEDLGWPF